MRPHIAGIILTVLAWMLGGTAAVHAQETVPETPPELRDFRLDEPRPDTQTPTEPATQPEQQTAPPPAVQTVPEPVAGRTAPAASDGQATPRRETQQAERSNTASTETGILQSPAIEDAVSGDPSAGPAPTPVNGRNEPATTVDPARSDWNINFVAGVALAALLVVGAVAFLIRRRRRPIGADTVETVSANVAEDSLPDRPVPKASDRLPPASASPPAKLKASPQPEPADISISFIPEKAVISFTNLTVQGQLQIANTGKLLARDMQLRAVLISASNQQQLAIDSFFGDPAQIAPNPLGEAKPGETLGLSLELSVPLSEMQAFPLGDQRLLVPILVASLTYAGENGETSVARLACMIGREAQPPKPKMGPLRLDKGPRSYAPLGQRPVYA